MRDGFIPLLSPWKGGIPVSHPMGAATAKGWGGTQIGAAAPTGADGGSGTYLLVTRSHGSPAPRSLLLLFLLLSHTGPTRNHLANQILFPVNPLPCSMDTHSHRIPQTRPRSPLPSSFSPLFPSALGFRVQQQPLMGSDLLLTDSQGSYWVGSWIIHHSRSNR